MKRLTEEDMAILRMIAVRTANVKYDEDGKKTIFNLGSGTIIGSGENHYVMTAGHCVVGMDENNIMVECFNGSSFDEVKVRKVVCCKHNTATGDDYALLLIEKPDNGLDYCQIIKRFDLTIPEDSYIMLSYPPAARGGRTFDVKKNIGDYWEASLSVDYSHDDFKSVISGSSGAGIFVYRHNRFYYVGLAVATRDDVGRFNDIKVLKPGVFDGYMPEDTKDNDYFDTLKTWENWNDGLNAKERRDIVRGLDVDWLDYLTRKAQVLFPSDYEKKVDTYIKYYVKGMRIIAQMLESNPSFVNELNKLNDKYFEKLVETHKEDFESSDSAYEDLKGIINDVKAKVATRFPEDREDAIAQDYALYRVAERLLNCHLDYKPKV